MSHTYASTQALKDYFGESTWTGSEDALLSLLEGASRRVDGFCARSDFGSGFGPRIGTNRYDHDGASCLYLTDDLIGVTSVSLLSATGGGTTSLTVDTDYYLTPYSGPPYTELTFTGLGAAPSSGLRVVTVAGTFGYSAETYPAGTLALASGTATAGTVTGGTVYAGQTLLVGSEQVYVTASTGGTALTLQRGVNGTTAAAGTAAAVTYRYPREVVTATLQLASRRHRSAQAGLTGDFGGGNLPFIGNHDNETSILRGTVGHLKRHAAG